MQIMYCHICGQDFWDGVLVFTGLVVGVLFGFALQWGRFCMNSAFRDIILMQEFTLLKALGIAILIEMLGFTILEMTGFITLNPKPLVWGANIAGGLIFGIGMVVAGGCASGITYRVGEGMVWCHVCCCRVCTGRIDDLRRYFEAG